MINNLYRLGAKVIYSRLADVHVSGHACQEELKLMLALLKPTYFIPVHGEYRHLKQHATLAVRMGIPEKNVIIAELGDCIEVTRKYMRKEGTVTAGNVLVDGLGSRRCSQYSSEGQTAAQRRRYAYSSCGRVHD